jgi:squalene-hopene/tetraprenyl-beta-curcumene cyclase
MSSGSRLATAHQTVRETLLAQRRPEGYWEGRLSSSALSTATAVSALGLGGEARDEWLVRRGLLWLRETQGGDGGYGDTPDSPSNLATSLLVLSAYELTAGEDAEFAASRQRLKEYVRGVAGEGPEALVAAVRRAYGSDRTFAVPILMNCALAGLVPWSAVPGLPFELAALPAEWYRVVKLQVVSYALPALIAVGLLLHRRHPPRNPLLRAVRRLVEGRVLRRLAAVQPDSGGYLEATPLTAFVTMSLVAAEAPAEEVICRALDFLRASMRPDGSWPIDTNLSVWVTSSAYQALQAGGGLSQGEARLTRDWLQARQLKLQHPYTGAAPGGWGWTHLPGSVPDGDDTAGALLALAPQAPARVLQAGLQWLLGLQNSDGGWPTFCRGWGQLPFDQSCADLTAHALRALQACRAQAPMVAVEPALRRGLRYLQRVQAADGSWRPLWFGSQLTPDQTNPVLGTARVLPALALYDPAGAEARRGIEYLLAAQHPSGGWGADAGIAPSVEETALAVTALTHWPEICRPALERGVQYLLERVADGSYTQPKPLGLYFARLWYAEDLYPVIWTLEALGRASRAGLDEE